MADYRYSLRFFVRSEIGTRKRTSMDFIFSTNATDILCIFNCPPVKRDTKDTVLACLRPNIYVDMFEMRFQMYRILDDIAQSLNCCNLNLNSFHLKCAVFSFVDFSVRHGKGQNLHFYFTVFTVRQQKFTITTN